MRSIDVTVGSRWLAQVQGWPARIWPELLALAITAHPLEGASSPLLPSLLLPSLLLSSALIRLAWCSAELVHGAGHALLRALVDQDCSALSAADLLEHRSPRTLLRALAPLGPIGLADGRTLPLPWVAVGASAVWKVRLKAGGGLLGNLLALATACGCLGWLGGDGAAPVRVLLIGLAAANAVLALFSCSDWVAIRTGRAARFHCGNFGVIGGTDPPVAGELLSPSALERFWTMGQETETRGAQAGGGMLLVRDGAGRIDFVGHKTINGKRGQLSRSLERGFRRARRRAVRKGCRPLPSALVAAWHYRFATSGPPTLTETHWHQWCPAQLRRLWSRHQGRWVSEWQSVQHRITHNGDFEAFRLFGTEMPVDALGSWLGAVLNAIHPAVGDSPKIAGMMDLLICKGDWFAAVRLASLRLLTVTDPPPAGEEIGRWAAGFEAAFQDAIGSPGAEHPVVPEELASRIEEQLDGDPVLRCHSPHRIQRWIHGAIGAFLHNDSFAAVRQFMACARGSFGLVVITSTRADRLVLSSLGQPITIGFDGPGAMAVYASEPAAVDAVLAGRRGCHRLDLDQNAGEIALLSARDLTIHSLAREGELSPEELRCRRHDYDGHPASTSAGSLAGPHRLDPVDRDLTEIPGLLSRIQDDWINPRSANRASAEVLGRLVIARAKQLVEKPPHPAREGENPPTRNSRAVDLLVTGMENSLWLGERFALDLEGLMPKLTVRALSANTVLHHLQHDAPALNLAPHSIVLVLSHSGQTFASRQVAEACDLLARQGAIEEVFLLTGEPASLLGSPWLSAPAPGRGSASRLFTTAAGRRTCEPATATVAAMHQTLTELLFCLCRQVQQAMPGERPLGLQLRPEALLALETLEDHLLVSDAREIIGVDERGGARSTPVSHRLVESGRRWAWHVLETPTAWFIHALYIVVSVEVGLPLFRGLTLGLLALTGLDRGAGVGALLLALAMPVDLALYVFGPWCWTLGLRLVQGRQPLARTGRRTLLIGEMEGAHQLLTSFVSKLFALSYGITALDVHGADPRDHLIHGYAHRVVRGTLLFLGIPDGRCSERQRAHATAVILAARQAAGIRHLGAGPEIVALSSDPCIAVERFQGALVIPSPIHAGCGEGTRLPSDNTIEAIRESRFGTLRRLLAAYVFFWAMAERVATFPVLGFDWWKSQSRTKVMTTASPVSAGNRDRSLPEEIEVRHLDVMAHPYQR